VIDGIQDMHLALEQAGGRAGGCRGGLAAPPPTRAIDLAARRSLVGVAVLESDVLGGGLRNTNCNLRLAGNEPPVVLRPYDAEAAAEKPWENWTNLNSGPWEKLEVPRQTRGKNRGKTTSTISHASYRTRTVVRKSSSKTTGAGNGARTRDLNFGNSKTSVHNRQRLSTGVSIPS
jgi:hypothetical protein